MPAPAVTTVHDALLAGRRSIEGTGSDEAALEAEILMMHALGIDRAHLYERLRDPVDSATAEKYRALVARRVDHEPVAYITGHREFFALDFEVTPAALIPRPETETLVELALAFGRGRNDPLVIVDIGVGAGAIAVALAHGLPASRIVATDTSVEALALAHRNADRLGVGEQIDFRFGDLLQPLGEPVDIIAANPPYVTTAQWKGMPLEIRGYEPRTALDGGADGLDVIRRLIAEAPSRLRPAGALFCEIGDWQGDGVRELATAAFPSARVEVHRDLAGRDRVLAVYC